MDNEQARFILSSARPSGADSDDPQVAEALLHAQRDPELARWLAEERRFDAAIAQKLGGREPPAHLRARLLAGANASRKPSRSAQTVAWWVGIAAAAALVVFGAVFWRTSHPDAPESVAARAPLLEWQQSCLGIFDDPGFALDLMDGNYPPLERYLVSHGTRILPELPFSPGSVDFVGCKVLAWRGQAVSFLCLRARTGELVHLFVVPRGTADETLLADGPHRAVLGEFATTTWIRGDLIALVASKMPPAQLEALLGPQVAGGFAPAVRLAAR